jgi:hypothetical protein
VLSIGDHRLHRNSSLPSTLQSQGCLVLQAVCIVFFPFGASYLNPGDLWILASNYWRQRFCSKVWMRRAVVRIFSDASSVQIGRCTALRAGRCTDYAHDARCRWFATIINYVTFASSTSKQENLVLGMSWMRFVGFEEPLRE